MLSRSRMTTRTFFILTVCCAMSYSQSGQAQVDGSFARVSASDHVTPRVIWKGRGNLTYPIATLNIFYDGKPIKAGVPFDAPDDWLRHISVGFVNRSSHVLTAGSLQLDFRELGGSPILFYDLGFGALPEHQLQTPTGRQIPRPLHEIPVAIASGATALIPFEPGYSGLRSAIEARGPLAEVKACWIEYGFFYFGNDLRWGIGSFGRANPSIPGKYDPTTPDDFMPKPQIER